VEEKEKRRERGVKGMVPRGKMQGREGGQTIKQAGNRAKAWPGPIDEPRDGPKALSSAAAQSEGERATHSREKRLHRGTGIHTQKP